MLPDFLSAYKADLEKFRMEYISIQATPLADGETLPLTQSKFLGKPYLPAGTDYPFDKNGKPMIMLAQINFSETDFLEHYPESGIFQLFVSPTDWYDMEDFKIFFHPDAHKEHQQQFDFLTKELYSESPIDCEHWLSFSKGVEYGATDDFRFDYSFNGMDLYDFEETLNEEEKKIFDSLICSGDHKIGGYAFFTQSDPRDYDSSRENDLLLLQIDGDEQIMFGDAGVSNVFINADDLKKRDFSRAYFNWDCC